MARRKHDPPTKLSKTMVSFWQTIHDEYELDPHHKKLLEAACRCWDRAEQARAVLDREGLTYTDRWKMPRPRPEVRIERENRSQFRVLVRELGLDVDGPPDSRPPRTGGVKH